MKKKMNAVLLSLCLVFSMTACGSAEETEEVESIQEETSVQEELTQEESTQEELVEGASTVEDFFRDVDLQSLLEPTLESLGDEIEMNVFVEGNDLIFECTIVEELADEYDVDILAEWFAVEIGEEASTFEDVAAQMNSLVGIDDCRVLIRCYYDGELLTEEIFEATSEEKAGRMVEEETEDVEAISTYNSLEEYFKTEEGQSILEMAKTSVEEGMNMEILAEGNDLVYVYIYEEGTLDASVLDLVSEQLVSALEGQASVFSGIASQMNALIGASDCRVGVRYYYEDTLLAEKYFEAE